MKNKLKIILYSLSILFIASCSNNVLDKQSNMEVIEIASSKLYVSVFETKREKKKGLMFLTYLRKNTGALFVYNKPTPASLWMKNMKISLDILFFDKTKKLIAFEKQVMPCVQTPCKRYTAKNVQYVVEVNAGFISKHNIKIGAYLKRHQ